MNTKRVGGGLLAKAVAQTLKMQRLANRFREQAHSHQLAFSPQYDAQALHSAVAQQTPNVVGASLLAKAVAQTLKMQRLANRFREQAHSHQLAFSQQV